MTLEQEVAQLIDNCEAKYEGMSNKELMSAAKDANSEEISPELVGMLAQRIRSQAMMNEIEKRGVALMSDRGGPLARRLAK